jgi:hypothetical protein
MTPFDLRFLAFSTLTLRSTDPINPKIGAQLPLWSRKHLTAGAQLPLRYWTVNLKTGA